MDDTVSDEKEAEVRDHFTEQVPKYGGWQCKVEAPMFKGFSDRFTVFPFGRIYLVELKRRRNGRIAHHQSEWAHIMWCLGVDVVYLNSKEEVDRWLATVA